MKRLRALRQFHEAQLLTELAQTVGGRIVILAVACALLRFWHQTFLAVPAAIVLIFLVPAHRRLILSIAAVGAIVNYYRREQDLNLTLSSGVLEDANAWVAFAGLVTLALLGLYALVLIAKLLPSGPNPVRRRPVVWLHSGMVGAFALVLALPRLAAVVEVVPWLVWRASYLMQYGQRGSSKGTSLGDHLFYLWPVQGGSALPYGKGLAYLSRHEAKDQRSEARARLAGLKVLVLATVWDVVLKVFERVFYGGCPDQGLAGVCFGLPTMDAAIRSGDGTVLTAWVTILLGLIHMVLQYAVIGHVIVGVLRLAGFNIFRNTYKPLLAPTIVDFWSRFNYYFKELMVEFFFYPTFVRCRFLNERLRLFVAVFAAAFVGNMYYHVLTSRPELTQGDYHALWEIWGARLVYCGVLAVGIWISMLRQKSARRAAVVKAPLVRLRGIAGVWLFYSIAHIWNVEGAGLNWSNRLEFSLRLLNLA